MHNHSFKSGFYHNDESIKANVENKTGVYLMYHGDNIITYVGRGDVKDRLTAHLKDEYKDERFTFLYTDDDDIACDLECANWHKHQSKNLKNKEHPKLSSNREKCPVLGCDHIKN